MAGGTGGHIYPAVAIINKIKDIEANSAILFIGTANRMEKDIIPKMGINFVGIEMTGLNRKNLFSNISVLKKYNKAIKKAKEIISDFKPDVVIGAGGYITAPVLYAAKKLKYPILIHEQNSIPGVSNKFIASFADRICVSLPGSVKYFPEKKTVYTGNPRSEEIINKKPLAKTELGFVKDKRLVVFVMGSLGSLTMTEKLKDLIPAFKNKDYQVLIITGNNYYDDYKNLEVPSNVKIVPFLDNLINLLKDTDLLVSRAGASTIAEATAIGLPTIFIPSPYVTNNHQYKNAKDLEKEGAAVIITEEEFSKEKVLKEIDRLFCNKEIYSKMRMCSANLGIKDSATRVYNEIRKIIR